MKIISSLYKWRRISALGDVLKDKEVPSDYQTIHSAQESFFEKLGNLAELAIITAEYKNDVLKTVQYEDLEERQLLTIAKRELEKLEGIYTKLKELLGNDLKKIESLHFEEQSTINDLIEMYHMLKGLLKRQSELKELEVMCRTTSQDDKLEKLHHEKVHFQKELEQKQREYKELKEKFREKYPYYQLKQRRHDLEILVSMLREASYFFTNRIEDISEIITQLDRCLHRMK